MAWTTPRTWVSGELVTASIVNTHIRDNIALLKTNMDSEGGLKTGLYTFGYSAGQANTTTGAWEKMTSYTVGIPANYLNVPGDALLLEGTFIVASNTNAKNFGFQIGTSTIITAWTGAENLANHLVFFRLVLRRRTSTAGAFFGVAWQGSGPFPATLSFWKLCSVAISGGDMDFTALKNLFIIVFAAGAGDLRLTDYSVCGWRSKSGATV